MDNNLAVNFIKSEFDKRKLNNKNYSLRSYAKNLGISPGYLSQLLSSKKELTTKALSMNSLLSWAIQLTLVNILNARVLHQ